MDDLTIGAGALQATVKAAGAELCSLRDAAGRELLWQAGPAWPRHAPVLFPIVGRLTDDRLRHGDASFHMGQHGFARDQDFAWMTHDAASCRLALTDSAATRAMYPFAFRLELAYAIAGDTLHINYVLTNPATTPLPASLGAHPAFAWPLAPGIPKEAHRIIFAADEPDPIVQLTGGLLQTTTTPTPVHGRTLALSEPLFANDALIFRSLHSTALVYEAPGGPRLTIGWEGFPQLGLWSRPPADFVCIEPWHGYASPTGFDGDFFDKPGLMHLDPGETRVMRISIKVE